MPPFSLVTGASSGIGRELSMILAREGKNVALVARSEARLSALADTLQSSHGVKAKVFAQDLGLSGAAEALGDAVSSAGLEIDVLVNNAGFGHLGRFDRVDRAIPLDMIGLNVTALTHLTHVFLPPMVARGRGRILNVASTAAFQPGPFMAVYYASKAFVLSFSEAIAEELRGTGVTVTALCPGPTRTEFFDRAEMAGSRLLRLGQASASSVAELGYRAMMSGRAVAVPGLMNRLLALSVRLSPRFAVRRVTGILNAGGGER